MKTMSGSSFSFLLIGAGRGGTSPLAGLLDSHSQLEIGFELFSIDYLMGRKMPWCSRNKKERLISDRVQAFRNACLRESLKFSGKLWGNKITSEQINGLEDHNRLNPGTKLDTLDYFFARV
ncbi:MAG: hypothetical protein M3Q76_10705 [Acidobacteriota bacterium]|nr:hypothetical protein [Acidobacteriota bacterium]